MPSRRRRNIQYVDEMNMTKHANRRYKPYINESSFSDEYDMKDGTTLSMVREMNPLAMTRIMRKETTNMPRDIDTYVEPHNMKNTKTLELEVIQQYLDDLLNILISIQNSDEKVQAQYIKYLSSTTFKYTNSRVVHVTKHRDHTLHEFNQKGNLVKDLKTGKLRDITYIRELFLESLQKSDNDLDVIAKARMQQTYMTLFDPQVKAFQRWCTKEFFKDSPIWIKRNLIPLKSARVSKGLSVCLNTSLSERLLTYLVNGGGNTMDLRESEQQQFTFLHNFVKQHGIVSRDALEIIVQFVCTEKKVELRYSQIPKEKFLLKSLINAENERRHLIDMQADILSYKEMDTAFIAESEDFNRNLAGIETIIAGWLTPQEVRLSTGLLKLTSLGHSLRLYCEHSKRPESNYVRFLCGQDLDIRIGAARGVRAIDRSCAKPVKVSNNKGSYNVYTGTEQVDGYPIEEVFEEIFYVNVIKDIHIKRHGLNSWEAGTVVSTIYISGWPLDSLRGSLFQSITSLLSTCFRKLGMHPKQLKIMSEKMNDDSLFQVVFNIRDFLWSSAKESMVLITQGSVKYSFIIETCTQVTFEKALIPACDCMKDDILIRGPKSEILCTLQKEGRDDSTSLIREILQQGTFAVGTPLKNLVFDLYMLVSEEYSEEEITIPHCTVDSSTGVFDLARWIFGVILDIRHKFESSEEKELLLNEGSLRQTLFECLVAIHIVPNLHSTLGKMSLSIYGRQIVNAEMILEIRQSYRTKVRSGVLPDIYIQGLGGFQVKGNNKLFWLERNTVGFEVQVNTDFMVDKTLLIQYRAYAMVCSMVNMIGYRFSTIKPAKSCVFKDLLSSFMDLADCRMLEKEKVIKKHCQEATVFHIGGRYIVLKPVCAYLSPLEQKESSFKQLNIITAEKANTIREETKNILDALGMTGFCRGTSLRRKRNPRETAAINVIADTIASNAELANFTPEQRFQKISELVGLPENPEDVDSTESWVLNLILLKDSTLFRTRFSSKMSEEEVRKFLKLDIEFDKTLSMQIKTIAGLKGAQAGSEAGALIYGRKYIENFYSALMWWLKLHYPEIANDDKLQANFEKRSKNVTNALNSLKEVIKKTATQRMAVDDIDEQIHNIRMEQEKHVLLEALITPSRPFESRKRKHDSSIKEIEDKHVTTMAYERKLAVIKERRRKFSNYVENPIPQTKILQQKYLEMPKNTWMGQLPQGACGGPEDNPYDRFKEDLVPETSIIECVDLNDINPEFINMEMLDLLEETTTGDDDGDDDLPAKKKKL